MLRIQLVENVQWSRPSLAPVAFDVKLDFSTESLGNETLTIKAHILLRLSIKGLAFSKIVRKSKWNASFRKSKTMYSNADSNRCQSN